MAPWPRAYCAAWGDCAQSRVASVLRIARRVGRRARPEPVAVLRGPVQAIVAVEGPPVVGSRDVELRVEDDLPFELIRGRALGCVAAVGRCAVRVGRRGWVGHRRSPCRFRHAAGSPAVVVARGGKPAGMCGSALIDFLAQAYKANGMRSEAAAELEYISTAPAKTKDDIETKEEARKLQKSL